MLFCKEQRPKVKEDHPQMTFGELGKELGVRWRLLSEAEKERYKAGTNGAAAPAKKAPAKKKTTEKENTKSEKE